MADISWDELEPLLGRGRMPVLETFKLSELLNYTRQYLELVAWVHGQDDAYGCDKFVMATSIVRQIYQRVHLGHRVSPEDLVLPRTFSGTRIRSKTQCA